MVVNLLIIATNKYIKFLPELISSAQKMFLTDCKVVYNVFTDKKDDVYAMFRSNMTIDLNVHEIEHYPWPYTTLFRYHFFAVHKEKMIESDYYFYIDADTVIKAQILKEHILGERVVVKHCGYISGGGTFETNPKSTSYVEQPEGKTYYGGGFWGFSAKQFWPFIKQATEMIDVDHENNIIPVWHDESVLNRIMIDVPPTLELSPSYHWPENNQRIQDKWPIPYECKIMLLDKNHKELRS